MPSTAISFELARGERLGLVGESGCGKSVTNLAIIRLLPKPAGRIEGGSVPFDGQDLVKLERVRHPGHPRPRHRDDLPGPDDEPEPGADHRGADGRDDRGPPEAVARPRLGRAAIELLGMVGIPQPEKRLKSFPHQFSGGMRQRVMIAMALALEPKLMIADEPTTALDVTIQAQVLELISRLTDRDRTSLILITHDLGVVAGMTDRINVMYAGLHRRDRDDRRPVRRPVAPVHGGPAALDAPGRRSRRRAADPDRGPAARHAQRADGLSVRAPLRLAARRLLDRQPGPAAGHARHRGRDDGRGATHRIACHNPPTPDEAVHGTAGPATRPRRRQPVSSTSSRRTRPSPTRIAEVAEGPATSRDGHDMTGRAHDHTRGMPTPAADEAAPRPGGPRRRPLLPSRTSRSGSRSPRGCSSSAMWATCGPWTACRSTPAGETLGLVGESGCGKSTTGRAIVRLYKPTAGRGVRWHGHLDVEGKELQQLRRRFQMIFQDPYASLNPRMTAGNTVGEPLDVHGVGTQGRAP